MANENRFRFRWEARQEAQGGEAEILLYSEIVSWKWNKEDDSERTAAEFDALVREAVQSGARSLRLRINSPGGSVAQAVAMKTTLETCGIPEIKIDIEGQCASAATFFVCIPGAKVRIAEGSEFMIHNPACGCWGTAAEFENQAERLRNMQEQQYGWYARRSGKSEDEIKAMMDKTTWLTAQGAIDNGFADEMITAPAPVPDEDTRELMEELYQVVPERLRPKKADSNGNDPAEHKLTKEENKMTLEELRQQDPELYREVLEQGRREGENGERQRIADIEELTGEGLEELAQKAKAEGTSAEDFFRQVVQHQKAQKKAYLDSRRAETGPAQNVTGGSDKDGDDQEAQELAAYLKEAKELAAQAANELGHGMY